MSDVAEQRKDSDRTDDPAGPAAAEEVGAEHGRPDPAAGGPPRPDLHMSPPPGYPTAPPPRPDLPLAPPPRPSLAPRATPREALDAPRPRIVDTSYWMWVVAALAAVLAAGLTLLDWDNLHDRMAERTRTEFPDETQATIDEVATAALGIFIGFGVVLALLMLAFATALRAQRGWARIVLVIVGLVAIGYGALMAPEIESAPQLAIVLTIVAVVGAVITMWTTAATEWLHARKVRAGGYSDDLV